MAIPYWLDEPAPPLRMTKHEGPVDAAVVGGGVTGCACALVLAEAGLRVRLYEARAVAEGASGRNGGFALRGTAAPYPVAIETVGREAAKLLWRRTEEELDAMQQLGGEAFRRTGSVRIAYDEAETGELREEYEALIADGFSAEWREGSDLRPEGRFAGGIFHTSDAALHPGRLVRRLAVLASEAGAEVREHDRVDSVDDLDAEHVVVATDGYPSGLLGELESLILPTRGQAIATEPISEELFSFPHYARYGFEYWQQTPEGRLVAGGFRDVSLLDELTTDEVTTPAIQEQLEDHVASLVGRPIRVTHRWAGLFGLVLDFLPVVGRVPGLHDVWVAGGYSGHGNVLGFMCGRLVADAILGRRRPELPLVDPARLL
jgi:glycine/D-amino acid oxidase-like deaminating enzyme